MVREGTYIGDLVSSADFNPETYARQAFGIVGCDKPINSIDAVSLSDSLG